MAARVKVTFSDHFGISKKVLAIDDLFDISLISDLPLFIDPFHLFYSKKPEYKELHDGIIKYLVFLRDLSLSLGPDPLSNGIVDAYYRFPEIKQNWLGFTFNGNSGHGLGLKFAQELNLNFHKFFKDFGVETKTRHFEKLTLISTGIGRDTISDFTTNQIINYLAARTEAFAKKYLPENRTRPFTIKKAVFDYEHQVWMPQAYRLPVFKDDFVILTPRDLLTKDAAWINKSDFIDSFSEIPEAASDAALREQVSRYLHGKIKEFAVKKVRRGTNKVYLSITKETRAKAAAATIQAFPQTVDIYIRLKEERGGQALARSQGLVERTEGFLDNQFREFAQLVGDQSPPSSYEEAYARCIYFKECIELKEGYKNMYEGSDPAGEEWVQRMFWFVWFGATSDVNRDPSNGVGEPDFAVSQGRKDKTLVEFKLAGSSSLEKNLLNQLEAYKKVDQTDKGIWVIIFFTPEEEMRVKALLAKHGLEGDKNYILVDARKDNKTSASKLK